LLADSPKIDDPAVNGRVDDEKNKRKTIGNLTLPTAPGHVIHSNNNRLPQALLAKGNYGRSKKYKSRRSHKLGHKNIHKVNAHK
jgi:hypothetical protein